MSPEGQAPGSRGAAWSSWQSSRMPKDGSRLRQLLPRARPLVVHSGARGLQQPCSSKVNRPIGLREGARNKEPTTQVCRHAAGDMASGGAGGGAALPETAEQARSDPPTQAISTRPHPRNKLATKKGRRELGLLRGMRDGHGRCRCVSKRCACTLPHPPLAPLRSTPTPMPIPPHCVQGCRS